MIFVTLGSQDKQFKRLVKKVNQLVKDGIIKEKVVVQAGCTKFRTDKLKMLDYLSIEDFQKYVQQSNVIITHGGVGSILDALKNQKKVIAVPRSPKYDEIANDHQEQIIEKFAEQKYLLSCLDVEKLDEALKQVDSFKPKKYISNNDIFLEFIIDLIENDNY